MSRDSGMTDDQAMSARSIIQRGERALSGRDHAVNDSLLLALRNALSGGSKPPSYRGSSLLNIVRERPTTTARSGVPLTRLPAYRPPIGISGFAGTGKTAAALFIESTAGYRRQHIAEPLRRMLASLLAEYGYDATTTERYLTGDLKERVVPELGVTSRHLQITLGTEWGREQIDPDLWAKLWAFQAGRSAVPTLNDSVRFPNEEAAIRQGDGFTILISRPGVGPRAFNWRRLGPLLYRWFGCMWGVHDSERVDRLRPDYLVINDGSLDQMRDTIAAILRARGVAAH